MSDEEENFGCVNRSTSQEIFLLRLKQLDYVRKMGDRKKEMEIKVAIRKDIHSLPRDADGVREMHEKIDRAVSLKFWENVYLDPVHYLHIHILPLMRFKPEGNPEESSFILMCERLGMATLENSREVIESARSSITEMIGRLPRAQDEVRHKQRLLDKVLSQSFWERVSYEETRQLMTEIAPLMRFIPENG